VTGDAPTPEEEAVFGSAADSVAGRDREVRA